MTDAKKFRVEGRGSKIMQYCDLSGLDLCSGSEYTSAFDGAIPTCWSPQKDGTQYTRQRQLAPLNKNESLALDRYEAEMKLERLIMDELDKDLRYIEEGSHGWNKGTGQTYADFLLLQPPPSPPSPPLPLPPPPPSPSPPAPSADEHGDEEVIEAIFGRRLASLTDDVIMTGGANFDAYEDCWPLNDDGTPVETSAEELGTHPSNREMVKMVMNTHGVFHRAHWGPEDTLLFDPAQITSQIRAQCGDNCATGQCPEVAGIGCTNLMPTRKFDGTDSGQACFDRLGSDDPNYCGHRAARRPRARRRATPP